MLVLYCVIFVEFENVNEELVYVCEIISGFMMWVWWCLIIVVEIDCKFVLFGVMRIECDSFEEMIVEVLVMVLVFL